MPITPQQPPTQDQLWKLAWDSLRNGVVQRKSEFHTLTLATLTPDGPAARTVILRKADEDSGIIAFNADFRSPKVRQMQDDPRVALLGYGVQARLQIRLAGTAKIHHDDALADEVWSAIPLFSRRTYLAPYPPTSVHAEFQPNHQPHLLDREPTAEESLPARENFAFVEVHLHQLDVLKLVYDGNPRARFCKKEETWDGEWLAP